MISSSFDVWRDWMNSLLASSRAQVQDCAIRHSAMSGASNTSTLMWTRTGSRGEDSGLFASMEHGGDVHSTSNVSELITVLKQLPESVRQEIVEALQPESGSVL